MGMPSQSRVWIEGRFCATSLRLLGGRTLEPSVPTLWTRFAR